MSCDLQLLANEAIRSLHPYQPGKPISELERELGISNIIKLASNENPLGCSINAKEAIIEELDEISRYPDANGYYLKEAIANKLSISIDQITLGNGSNDVLNLIARTFAGPDSEVIFSQHAFVVYPIAAKVVGADAMVIPAKEFGHDLKAMTNAISDKTRLIFIANPNNPTGTCLYRDELKNFMDTVPENVIVVMDEAYYEYVDDDMYPQTIPWIEQYPNLIVTRTFSKAYGLAGARIGYSVSHKDICGLLNRIREPFNVNSFAMASATAALKDHQFLQQAVLLNREGMAFITEQLQQMGLNYIPSKGNFVTVDMGGDAAPYYQKLLHQGVIVRPVANYEMPNHLRVSIGLMSENERFIDALKLVLGN